MLWRTKVWTCALGFALLCSVGWVFIPGECVVQPVGASQTFLSGSVFSTFLHPFAFDPFYVLYFILKLSPVALVLLAVVHWRRRFEKLRAVAAFYAMALSAAVAFNPYRAFSDVDLIVIVSIWGIVILVAYESKASPGSALLALMSIQLVMSEVYSGLGASRGLPFWVMVTGVSIIFCYGLFHYTRMLRHGVLGKYSEIHQIGKTAVSALRALDAEREREDEEQRPG